MKSSTRILALLLALGVATPILAQTGYDNNRTTPGSSTTGTSMMKVSGTVLERSDDMIKVRTDAGTEMKFEVDEEVTVVPEVREGARVDIEYNELGAGSYRASMVRISTAASPGTGQTGDRGTLDNDTKVTTDTRTGTDARTGTTTYGDTRTGTTDTRTGTTDTRTGTMTHDDHRTDAGTTTTDRYVGEDGTRADGTTTGRTRLPDTASPIPLIGALGALALGGATGLRYLRRRIR